MGRDYVKHSGPSATGAHAAADGSTHSAHCVARDPLLRTASPGVGSPDLPVANGEAREN